jgi:hypothetical protein
MFLNIWDDYSCSVVVVVVGGGGIIVHVDGVRLCL